MFYSYFFHNIKRKKNIFFQIEYNLKSHKSILLVGDYCTGKTSILHRIQWKYRDAVIVQAKEKMSAIELRRAIEAKTNVVRFGIENLKFLSIFLQILHDVEQKVVRYLLVDDIHLVSDFGAFRAISCALEFL